MKQLTAFVNRLLLTTQFSHLSLTSMRTIRINPRRPQPWSETRLQEYMPSFSSSLCIWYIHASSFFSAILHVAILLFALICYTSLNSRIPTFTSSVFSNTNLELTITPTEWQSLSYWATGFIKYPLSSYFHLQFDSLHRNIFRLIMPLLNVTIQRSLQLFFRRTSERRRSYWNLSLYCNCSLIFIQKKKKKSVQNSIVFPSEVSYTCARS